jgi:hypothetical protein
MASRTRREPLRHNNPGSALDLNQLQIEYQILTRQLMIGIQHNEFGLYVYDHDRDLLAGVIGHHQLHPYFRFHLRGELVNGEFYNSLRISGAIGIFRGDLDGLLLSYRHTHYTIIESFDHHTAAHFKLQRTTTFRRIECCSVRQPTEVMNFYGISCFNFLCHVNEFSCFYKIAARGY